MAGTSNRENSETSKYDNDSTLREKMATTEELPPSTQDSNGSSSSSTPVPPPPVGQKRARQSTAKAPQLKPPGADRVLRSNAAVPVKTPAVQQRAPQAKPAPKRQKPQAGPPVAPPTQPGPSVAPAQPSTNRKAPAAPEPTTKPFEIDPDTILLLSALDSYHDFSGSRSCLNNIMVKDLIISFIDRNEEVLTLFNQFTVSKKINNKTLEHRVYEKYVTENENITTKLKVQLNTGKTTNDDITPETVLDVLSTFFNIGKDKIFIINDSGSLTGCKKGLKYLTSYASWFDSGGCDDITKYPYNHSLASSISVTKNSKDLLYIEKIEGLITNNNNAEGTLTFGNGIENFNQTKNDYDRPEVPSYSSYIKKITKNTFFNGIFSKLTVPRQQMFLMDLKRAGDGLQIVSGKDPTLDGLMKYPVFITNDIIAATISVNKGVRTVLTSKDHEALDDAVHSIKYANLLVPNNLLNKEDLIKRINAGLAEYAAEQKIQWGKLSEQDIGSLNNIINDLTSKITIPEFLNNIERFKQLKKEVQNDYDKYRLQILNNIVLLKQKYESNVDLKKTDLEGFEIAFNKTFEAIKTCNIFEVIRTNLQKCFNKDRITRIDDYCKSSTPMMKKYLSYITNLIKNPNINDDYDYSLIPKLYDNINNIYDVINKEDFFQDRRIIGTILDTKQITSDIKQLVINIRIAQILFKLFIADKLKYKEIIGYDSSTKANNHIKSPIGVIYMEYLLKLTTPEEIEKVIGVIKLLNSFSVLIESEANRLIDNTTEKDKYLPIPLKNYLSETTQEVLLSNPLRVSNTQHPTEKAALIIKESTYANKPHGYSGLLDFYTRIVHTHNAYMGIQTPKTTGGGRSKKTGERSKKTGGQQSSLIKRLKTPFENYDYTTKLDGFMKHPFGVKEMIIKLCEPDVRKKILLDIFNKYYKSDSYDINVLKKELLILKETKKLIPQDHGIISGGAYKLLRNTESLQKLRNNFKPDRIKSTVTGNQKNLKEKLKQEILKQEKLKLELKVKAFNLFVEYIDIFPEYIDPVMMTYMKYSNSPLPVYGLTKDTKLSAK
jgi:hypothetical protein